MSDNSQEKEAEMTQESSIPPQVSAADTSNQDDKVSTDPSGAKYIRTLSDDEQA